MTRLRMVLIIIALAALVTTAALTRGFGLVGSGRPETLALSGNVDIRQVDLGFRVSGRIAVIPFEEGEHVREGAVLAELDPRPLNDQLEAAEAQIASASAELEKRRNGNRAQDIAQAEAQLADRRAQLAKARADFDRKRDLISSGAVSREAFDTSRAQYLADQAQVTAAEQALSLQHAGSRAEDIAAAEAQHNEALAKRDAVRTDLTDAVLRAPNAGVILTRAREPGAIVQPGETVMTLTIERPVRVRAYIAEPGLTRISPGMQVEVTADGAPRLYHGTIGYIAPTAEFTPKTVQTEDLRSDLVYRVRVIVNDPDDGLRQGQPVTVRVPSARPPGGTQ